MWWQPERVAISLLPAMVFWSHSSTSTKNYLMSFYATLIPLKGTVQIHVLRNPRSGNASKATDLWEVPFIVGKRLISWFKSKTQNLPCMKSCVPIFEFGSKNYLCMSCYQSLVDILCYRSTCIHQEYYYKCLDSRDLTCIHQCLKKQRLLFDITITTLILISYIHAADSNYYCLDNV